MYSISTNFVFQYVQNMSSNGNLRKYISITSFLYSRFSKILLKYTYSSALSIPEKGKKDIFIYQWNKLMEKYLPISCKGSSCWHTLYYHQLECSLLIKILSQCVVFHRGIWILIPPMFICLLFTMFSSLYTKGLLENSLLGSSFLCKKAISVPIHTWDFPLNFIYCKKGN